MGLILQSFSFLKRNVTEGHSRSIKAKKNIIASFFIKGLSIAISLVLVPLTIEYVNPSQYGIWLTVSSIIAWFSFFDIGLTQGLRNKFAAAKAEGNDSLAQTYVSTTYAIVSAIFFALWLIFLLANQFLSWPTILNIPGTMGSDVAALSMIVFTYFCVQFVLRIINTIIIADQQAAKASVIDLVSQALSLVFIAILVKTTQGSLVKLGFALCLAPIIVLLAANIFFFNKSYKKYRPRLSKVNLTYSKSLFNLGLIFFVIQVANIIQYETANIIIARSFGTVEVTNYNIVYKYFSVLLMVFMIFIGPFWSASTEAYIKKDIEWIKRSMKMYSFLNVGLVLIGVIMLLISDKVYALWLGKGKVDIDVMLSFYGFLFFNTSIFGGKYVSFLNGINALKLQFWACLVSPFVFIFVSYLLIEQFNLGVYSLFIAAIISNFNTFLLAPLQYHKIVHLNKKGIWIR